MASKLVEKRQELEAKQKALHDIFEAAGPEMDLAKAEALKEFKSAQDKAREVKRLNDELTTLGKEVEELVELEGIADGVKRMGEDMGRPAPMTHPAQGKGGETPATKSLGELFVESAAFKRFAGRQGPLAVVPADVKATMTTAAGWAPQSIRLPGYVPSAQRQPTVTDIIPLNTTTQAAIVYMEETTFTNNAAERAEAAAAGEAALALTERTANVRSIATFLPVTEEQMRDVPYIQGYVTNRLTLMLRQRLSQQLLIGDGVAPNLEGLLVNAGVQSQAKGADPVPDAIYKGMTLVRVTGRAEPNAVVMHPNDWQDIRLLRTADGIYIWGSPSEAGPERIWGLQVIQDTAETENTGLVGDFADFCDLVMRQEIEFEVSNSHSDYFTKLVLAIRAALRAAFPIYRPAAFCKITGI